MEIKTTIHIQASPQKVWAILTNFKDYPTWNPFIKSITGDVKVGNQIIARLAPPGASAMTFKPTVLALKEPTEFRWLGHLFVKGLFDGEHIFELIKESDGTTTFIQREKFKGWLLPLFKKMLNENTVNGFNLMNLQLKKKAELSE